MTYHWQAVDHDASISAERNPAEHDQVVVEIWVGDDITRITVWAEEFGRMAKEALDA